MKYIYLLVILILQSCNTRFENFFNGNFTQIESQNRIHEFEVMEFDFPMIGIDKFIIADTFIVTQNSSKSDFLISLYSLNNKEHIADIMGRGHGNNEYLGVNLFDDYFFENGELKLWIAPDNEKKIMLVNMSKSVALKSLIIEKEYALNRKNIGKVISWDCKKANDSILYGVNLRKNGASFIKYDYSKDTITSEVELLGVKINGDISLVSGATYVNNDETRFVNMMLYFNQLNFYDYERKKGDSFSLADSPIDYITFDNIQKSRHCYYSDIALVGNHIIIAYSSDAESDYCDNLHIYNWNGELINVLKIDADFLYIRADKKNNDIYLYGVEEKVYKGNVTKFINKIEK